jgi:hypothetical protein
MEYIVNSWYDDYYRDAYKSYSKDELIGFIIKLQWMHNNHVQEKCLLKTMMRAEGERLVSVADRFDIQHK